MMVTRFPLRLYGALAIALLFVASPVAAQFTPRSLNDPATGEQFHIEGSAGFWVPTANMPATDRAALADDLSGRASPRRWRIPLVPSVKCRLPVAHEAPKAS